MEVNKLLVCNSLLFSYENGFGDTKRRHGFRGRCPLKWVAHDDKLSWRRMNSRGGTFCPGELRRKYREAGDDLLALD